MSDWTIPAIAPYGQGAGGTGGDPAGYLLDVPLASFAQRAVAGLIDYAGPFIVVPLVAQRILSMGDTITIVVVLAVIVANSIVFQAATGCSFGKGFMDLQLAWPVYRRGETNPTLVRPPVSVVTGRLVGHLVDWPLTLGYGFLRPLRDPRRQTFADQITKTVVIADDDLMLDQWELGSRPML